MSRFCASGMRCRKFVVERPLPLLPGSIEDVGVIILAGVREITEFPDREGSLIGRYSRTLRRLKSRREASGGRGGGLGDGGCRSW